MSALVWIRNDFRFLDNPALFAAASRDSSVLLVYICPEELSLGSASRVWLERSLETFGERARERGFGWVIRRGDPVEIFRELWKETKATHLFWNRRYESEALREDARVQEILGTEGLKVETFTGNLLLEPWAIKKVYKVFSPYWRTFQKMLPKVPEAPDSFPKKRFVQNLFSLSPGQLGLVSRKYAWPKKLLSSWQPGEEHAIDYLDRFCSERLLNYLDCRDNLEPCGTSMLSPYIHFGEISVRNVWNMVLDYGRRRNNESVAGFLRQLVWREFTHSVMYNFPKTLRDAYKPMDIVWRKKKSELIAWQQGKTGIPIVDAGMRQLYQTGWVHNRARMIVSSFLVKDLLHSWREGMEWFWDTLVDADAANNTFGWQWIAGCGIDSMPWFRKFNPLRQAERFDPDGAYVRKYVPELEKVPNKYIHQPWLASKEELKEWGVVLGDIYPVALDLE